MTSLSTHIEICLVTLLFMIIARASWHKFTDFYEAVGFAQDYDVVPAAWTPLLVRALAIVEASTALALIVPASRAWGSLIAGTFFFVYLLLMVHALGHGKSTINCGCGGAPQPVSQMTLLRNITLIAMAGVIAVAPPGTIEFGGIVIAVLAGCVAFSIYSIAELLASHEARLTSLANSD